MTVCTLAVSALSRTASADGPPAIGSAIPSELRDLIDETPNPAGVYRALDVLVPALMDYMNGVDAAAGRYNAALEEAELANLAGVEAADQAWADALDAAEDAYLAELQAAEADWSSAMLVAEAVFEGDPFVPPYDGFGESGSALLFAQQGGGEGGGGWAGFAWNIWETVASLPQAAFDVWEASEWELLKLNMEIFLSDRPAASMLFGHSLQDNPPDLAFPAGHFITQAIFDSGEYRTKVNEFLDQKPPLGPGVYYGEQLITYSGGTDLHLSVGSATAKWKLVVSENHTWTLSTKMTDTYDFDLHVYRYYSLSITGIAVTVANNIAWADQLLMMIETYDWEATLPEESGTW